MEVPFVDLKRLHEPIRPEIDAAIKKVVDSNAYILGAHVENFENDFAAYCGVKHAVATSNGTTALHLALMAAGVKQGDEVITVPNTFIATAEAISHCNAVPRFVDINEKNFTIDTTKIEAAVTKKTKAIIPVHLYGQCCDMKPIQEIAEKHSLTIIEDSCQAHGAEYNGKKAGSLGQLACFSFYPAKNLGALGEGGCVVLNSDEMAERIRVLRGHGEKPKNLHAVIGYNYRMPGLQGAVLGVKLRHLDEWNNSRRESAAAYKRLLQNTAVEAPAEESYAKHVYHLYVVKIGNRDTVREKLQQQGISTGLHYPRPIHLQQAYSFLGLREGSLPKAEAAVKRILSLPMFPFMRQDEIEFTVEKLLGALK